MKLLSVWLGGERVGELVERRTNKLALRYDDALLDRVGSGRPLLSVLLPTSSQPYPPSQVRPFVEGLLPEGPARDAIERRFAVPRGLTFPLLAAIGRECAGAVAFVAAGEPGPAAAHDVVGVPVPMSELAAALDDLDAAPLGAGEAVRLSLAGVQQKLLLARTAAGEWVRPVGDVPSTHLLKPQDERFPDSVANEAFCLRVAAALGLDATQVETFEVGGRAVLAVERFDRRRDVGGAVSRIHQEDLCQACGIDVSARPDAKYQAGGGPGFAAVARVLDRWCHDAPGDLHRLAQVMTLFVALGNADGHGKNLALLYEDRGIRMAPLYDVLSTVAYDTVATPAGRRPVSRQMAMAVGDRAHIDAVTVTDLVGEAASWPGVRRADAVAAVDELLESLPDVLHRVAGEMPNVPDRLVELIGERVGRLRTGR